MQNVIAFADNDVVVIAWSYGHKLIDCMGFAVYRIRQDGEETPLPSMAVFPGYERRAGQTTEVFPVQKFYWKDPYARLVATPESRKFRYKVMPLEGEPGKLKPMAIGFAISNEVEVTPHLSEDLAVYFNRGIISTQHVSNAFSGRRPDKANLLKRIAVPDDRLRLDLAGEMIAALVDFVHEAQSGELYCALYEVNDQQLIEALAELKSRLHIVLSNPRTSDKQSASSITDGNANVRKRLKAAGAEVFDRMLPANQLGHNKFAVMVKEGQATAVLFGSTNWTSTGLCTQTNNTIIWREGGLSARYLEYWRQLADDTQEASGDPAALQGRAMRTWDAKSRTFDLSAGATVTSWFSPNTPALRKSKSLKEKRPPDMEEVATLMLEAKQAILFVAFYPGTPSIVNWAAQAQKANKELFVRGCVTNPSAAEGFVYELKGTSPPRRQRGDAPGPQDPRVIAAEALDEVVPKPWKAEILNAGFAVTHDKIVVVDPFSDHCVVVTGSHNLGYKASFNNDENLVIVRGVRRMAEAYATHVLDVYDHFSWRWLIEHKRLRADASLEVEPNEWQSRYYGDDGAIKNAQLRFWLSAIPSS